MLVMEIFLGKSAMLSRLQSTSYLNKSTLVQRHAKEQIFVCLGARRDGDI